MVLVTLYFRKPLWFAAAADAGAAGDSHRHFIALSASSVGPPARKTRARLQFNFSPLVAASATGVKNFP